MVLLARKRAIIQATTSMKTDVSFWRASIRLGARLGVRREAKRHGAFGRQPPAALFRSGVVAALCHRTRSWRASTFFSTRSGTMNLCCRPTRPTAAGISQAVLCCSLSPRERVGVRGKCSPPPRVSGSWNGCLGKVQLALAACLLCHPAGANPVGGQVAQGTATFNSQGPVLTIQTSDRTRINWNSFNIGVGETTTFLQPSSSSVVWNQINDSSASQILGNLNANGYIVLQNPNGFYIGGQAVVSAHGVIMTTSTTPAPDLSSPSAWQFNAPPPTASIINFGQIRQPDGDHGGAAFLIAADIQNNGSIQAPQGQVGLFAGQQVMVSERPDGRGLSARVTLPQGSINNQGQIVADAGTIQMHAAVVNQGGLVQANSVKDVNGVIELVATDLSLGPSSSISAQGDATASAPSEGGFVVLKADRNFTDSSTSRINVSGKSAGRDGVIEIFGNGLTLPAIQSQVDNKTASQYSSGGGWLMVNPQDITLSLAPSTPSAPNPTLSLNDLGSFSKIDLFAAGHINLASSWNLPDTLDANARLTLSAGNSITLQDSSAIIGGNNWDVNMSAGPGDLTAKPASGYGIYLNGNAYVQTMNGNIDLWAANEVIVNPGQGAQSTGDPGFNGIRTLNGGSISVTAKFGDVNAGGNAQGFIMGLSQAPYYTVSPQLGGISTAAGGSVSIAAGGNVTSYLPRQNDYVNAQNDAGVGAFGPEPGNVTVTAGGNISGHYVLANGVGSVVAGGNIGSRSASGGFALSLIKGAWNVSAAGSLFIQDIRNPNGILNDSGTFASYPGYHFFDYDPYASVTLSGTAVEFTGVGAPHSIVSIPSVRIPFILPPTLIVDAGSGGFTLDNNFILFPSPYGELRITTHDGGNLQALQDPLNPQALRTISMSDSAATQWNPQPAGPFGSFLLTDHAQTPPELNNPNPVEISVSGSIRNVTLRTTKATQVTVAGDTYNFGLLGENLHPGDITYVNVAGNISYPSVYQFVNLGESITSPNTTFSASWDAIFSLMVDPNASLLVPPQYAGTHGVDLAGATRYAFDQGASHLRLVFNPTSTIQNGYDSNANPGFIYDPATGQLGYRYQMSQNVFSALDTTTIRILKLDPATGQVVVERHPDGQYYFATTTASFASPSEIEALHAESVAQSVVNSFNLSPGFQIGGPGQLNINAASIDLGSSGGIVSWGIANGNNPVNYASLAPWTPSGAEVNVKATDGITLLTSTIASIYGGDVTVNSGGAVKLSLGDFLLIPPSSQTIAYGIWTSGHSDVSVTAQQDIDVGGARIATFNGGNVFVESFTGNVNAGNGANELLLVPIIYFNSDVGRFTSGQIGNPRPFGSGIIAISPTAQWQTAGGNPLPGNITVDTPNGDIVSTLGGIQQFALNGSVAGGPTITLTAGTSPSANSPGYPGNVDLGQGGVIGGTVNISAQGSVKGLILSRQNANINAAQSFSGTLLSGGTANLSAGGTVAGTVIGIGGVNAAAGAGVSASVLGQNVSIGGGAAQSTLGTSASASTAGQSAAQQASADARERLAKDTTPQSEDPDKKKRLSPTLVKRIGRVTVILPGG